MPKSVCGPAEQGYNAPNRADDALARLPCNEGGLCSLDGSCGIHTDCQTLRSPPVCVSITRRRDVAPRRSAKRLERGIAMLGADLRPLSRCFQRRFAMAQRLVDPVLSVDRRWSGLLWICVVGSLLVGGRATAQHPAAKEPPAISPEQQEGQIKERDKLWDESQKLRRAGKLDEAIAVVQEMLRDQLEITSLIRIIAWQPTVPCS
jgi:hypothetical protein